nr:hypothetical protein [Gemmatimonadaceae bacterium]
NLPACNASRLREMRYQEGVAGTADGWVVCEKDAANVYAWQGKGQAALDALFLTPAEGNAAYQPLDDFLESVLSADSAHITDATTAQALFPSTQDAFTVASAKTYRMRCAFRLANAGTAVASVSFLIGGTAVLGSVRWFSVGSISATDLTNTTTLTSNWHNAATAAIIMAANAFGTAHYNTAFIDGTIRVTTTGTIIPQIQWSFAPGDATTVRHGSFCRLEPIGSDAVTVVGSVA